MTFRGVLREGRVAADIGTSVFALDDHPDLELHVSRSDFRHATWNENRGVLGLVIGNAKVAVSRAD